MGRSEQQGESTISPKGKRKQEQTSDAGWIGFLVIRRVTAHGKGVWFLYAVFLAIGIANGILINRLLFALAVNGLIYSATALPRFLLRGWMSIRGLIMIHAILTAGGVTIFIIASLQKIENPRRFPASMANNVTGLDSSMASLYTVPLLMGNLLGGQQINFSWKE